MPTFSSLPIAAAYIEEQQKSNAVNLPSLVISRAVLIEHLNEISPTATLSVSIIIDYDGSPSLLIYDKAQAPLPGGSWPPVCRITSYGQRVCCPPTCNQSITVSNFDTEEQALLKCEFL